MRIFSVALTGIAFGTAASAAADSAHASLSLVQVVREMPAPVRVQPAPVREKLVSEAGQCDAGALQSWVGSTATQDLAKHLLSESGARRFQWIPPRSQVTADYRRDRLRVSYDDEMTITRIACN